MEDNHGRWWVQVDPYWYNSGFVASLPGGQALGWSGRQATGNGSNGWRQVSLSIPATLRGQSQVRFRVVFVSNGSVQADGFAFDMITIGDAPQVNLGADGYYCPGTVLDAGNPGLQYLWSNGATTRTVTLENNSGSPIIDSTISLTITNSRALGQGYPHLVYGGSYGVACVVAAIPVSCFGQEMGRSLPKS